MSTTLRHFHDPLKNIMRFEITEDGQVTLLTASDGQAGLDAVYDHLQPRAMTVIQRLISQARATGSATLP